MKFNSATLAATCAMLLLLICGSLVWALRIEPMPDFGAMDIPTKKREFFAYMRPPIEAANAAILADRARLTELRMQLKKGQSLGWLDRRFLFMLAAAYDLSAESPAGASGLADQLMRRVDIIPAALMLVQAAKESGWGTSKFAVQGNNFFGQQCFRSGCGFVPSGRDPGRRHEVARFDSVADSVDAYLHNVNTHPSYKGLRDRRAQLRRAQQALTGSALADGLTAYSEGRGTYIEEVKAMIRQNQLE